MRIDLPQIVNQVDEMFAGAMTALGMPGMAVALTDANESLAVRTYGFAELASRAPMDPDRLFQIGSIGKSFTACAILQLVDEGRLDLHAPVTLALPWLEVRSRFEPITVHHLLTHTAGLVRGPDVTSDSMWDVWALRDIETGSAPGSRYHYSNVGYRVLGHVIEAIDGRSYGEAIRERVLTPAGMDASEPAITNATRWSMATGYEAWPDDRPGRRGELAPATWVETATGDGCVAATADDMAAYVRALVLRRGVGPGGRIVAPEAFDLMSARHIEEGAGRWYGYGLETSVVGGHTTIGHGGSMVGYASEMWADPDAGFGVVVLMNGPDVLDHGTDLCRSVLAMLRGDHGDGAVPPQRTLDPFTVDDADALAGRYRSHDHDRPTVTLAADGAGLLLRSADGEIPLERRGPDSFFVDHPAWREYLLTIQRHDGAPATFGHGPSHYLREGSGTKDPRAPGWMRAFAGRYRSYNPWFPVIRVVQRGTMLFLIDPSGQEERLRPLEPREGRFSVGEDEGSPERIRFDQVVAGKTLRANLSGCDYFRTLIE